MSDVLDGYDLKNIAIGTLGSHTALNIFKGAKEEGFRTVCVCKEKDAIMYRKFGLADEMIIVADFKELIAQRVQERLRKLNVVLIPHGSFTAHLSTGQLTRDLHVPMFGNRELLHIEPAERSRRHGCAKPGLSFRPPSSLPMTLTGSPSRSCRAHREEEDISLPHPPKASIRDSTTWSGAGS